MITVSAPGKIHLLGEHAVVYGKPALLATVGLRVTVTLNPAKSRTYIDTIVEKHGVITAVVESVIKKKLNITKIPPYKLEISSQIPIGSGLGSSAAVSAAYIAALLSFLKVRWNLKVINELAYEAEKAFHGNPSGGDNSTVVYGGLLWFRKESPGLKIIQPLQFSILPKLAKNFILVNTGKPQETTKQMVEMVSTKYKVQSAKLEKIFDNQEQLVKNLLLALRDGNENQLIQIIRAGERNLEAIGVVSPSVKSIIRKIEQAGGAAKICGAGGKTKATGVLLCYHSKPSAIENIAKAHNLDYFKTALGVQGLRMEN